MSEQASEKIREMVAQLEPVKLDGVYKGIWMLTPRSMQWCKILPFWETRAEFKTDLKEGALHLNHHIYEGGLKFPDVCPVNLEASTHYDVVEVLIQRPVTKRTIQADLSREQLTRILLAIYNDRYWFAIPFCHHHGPKDRMVHIHGASLFGVPVHESRGRVLVQFRNREYAQRFGKLNNLTNGKWLAKRHLVMRVVGYLGLISSGAVAGAMGIILYQGLRGGSWGIHPQSKTITEFVVGLVLFIVSIFLIVRGNRGEQL